MTKKEEIWRNNCFSPTNIKTNEVTTWKCDICGKEKTEFIEPDFGNYFILMCRDCWYEGEE